MPASDLIRVSDDGPVRTVRINRPEKKNALTAPMYAALSAAFEAAARDDVVRCILIAGAPGAFCAGNDLQEFLDAAEHGEGLAPPAVHFLVTLARADKPLVAAVDGLAVGIGTTLLFHCDHVVAASDARFATPFVSLGLVPEAASSLLAPRRMGYARAFSLLAMGRPLDAAGALAAGIVNTVVASAEVEAEAGRAAREIAALPAEALALTRRLLRGDPDDAIERIEREADLFRVRLASPEARAAFETFLSKKR
ncbi:MAG TPA: crotonase/enoyl-CoA hydratase family protein [Xanthobacteraceae bacterium]|nr:crotonase/enoyl-CoA hydratase family protein [Xanthobacteraceae bacterium]